MTNARGPWSPDYCKACGEMETAHGPTCPLKTTPRLEPTKAGMQAIIPDTPGREIPRGGLKPKRAQTEKPTLLEMFTEEQRQRKLF